MSTLHPIYQKPYGDIPQTAASLVVGMGCFWGAERLFWQQPGVCMTQVGYAGGFHESANYADVCAGNSDHAEVVKIHFIPSEVTLTQLLALFWESHNPTQGWRQGNDVGPQYRSLLLYQNQQQHQAMQTSLVHYQHKLQAAGIQQPIATEIAQLQHFFIAEEKHQQYLNQHPNGYCGLGGLGIEY
ncbi:Peptide methionine sulfoxide reductase MsrA [Vibrio stylophorae]|uniref:Peptide methionine sulfoxide reductase MsrA n=1 Tax=Vibrio stylophorae TaxID=659351 RepID=A0ABN8DWZ5_9VIBR|nr:peptide-methionine (S)-S-oxide reductase MsrA [Vibrio stylophorae]CAH0534491.1 Peptide methionine sulfoxide reductase MsrA [Vibrio stylophorae]